MLEFVQEVIFLHLIKLIVYDSMVFAKGHLFAFGSIEKKWYFRILACRLEEKFRNKKRSIVCHVVFKCWKKHSFPNVLSGVFETSARFGQIVL